MLSMNLGRKTNVSARKITREKERKKKKKRRGEGRRKEKEKITGRKRKKEEAKEIEFDPRCLERTKGSSLSAGPILSG